MAVNPDLLKQMMAGAGGGAMPTGAPASGPPAAGAGAPMAPPKMPAIGAPPGQPPGASPLSTPQPKKGLQTAARTNVHIAVNMLEEALAGFGSESDEGADILKALNTLRKHVTRRDTSDLVPAEVLHMVSRLPQMGGGTQVQQALMKQMQGAKPPVPTPGMPPGGGGGPQLPGV